MIHSRGPGEAASQVEDDEEEIFMDYTLEDRLLEEEENFARTAENQAGRRGEQHQVQTYLLGLGYLGGIAKRQASQQSNPSS